MCIDLALKILRLSEIPAPPVIFFTIFLPVIHSKNLTFEKQPICMRLLIASSLILFLWLSCQQPGPKSPSTIIKQDSLQQRDTSPVTACLLSQIAYCKEPQKAMDQFMPGWKMVWDPAPVRGIYAFVATDGITYGLAIRGSLIEISWDAFDNWIYTDLNVAYQKDWPFAQDAKNAKVSQGAFSGWENLNMLTDKKTRKSLWSFLQTHVDEKKPLVITGHSLGGNLASVYASWLWKKYKDIGHLKKNIMVITFAAPATGNQAFADDFNSKFPHSLRIENIHDPIPKFPVAGRLSDLSSLFSPVLMADSIMVGYKNATVKLSNVFVTMGAALELMRITNGISPYVHTNGLGDLVNVKLSGKNIKNAVTDWFNEARYQHALEQYAAAVNCPIIRCTQ